ncbi:MAG: VCBS repeat-containing protein [Elusimicrobia bacterium]|nr:VCBS repeat-containing protein [Elusimicrobiota bacterium]
MRAHWLVLALSLSSTLNAAPIGYVVSVDSGRVFLDFNAASGAAVGQEFLIFTDGRELKHPVTGASLGHVEDEIASGKIMRITDQYSVGILNQLDAKAAAAAAPSAGQKVRLITQPPPTQPAAPQASPTTTAPPQPRAAAWKSPLTDFIAIAFAVGDVDGDGKLDAVMADEDHVYAYPTEGAGEWKPFCQFKNDSTGSQNLSLEAVDLDKNGRAEVFATYRNVAYDRVETAVLDCEGGSFKVKTILPYMVRSYQEADGIQKLAAQGLERHQMFSFDRITDFAYRDGKYVRGSEIKGKRLEWLYGFSFGKDASNGNAFPITLTKNYSLKVQFSRNNWMSKESYGQTPNRIRWQDRDDLFTFYPRMILETGPNGLEALYLPLNHGRLGQLTTRFGLGTFDDGEIHRLKWNAMSMIPDWNISQLGGYVADIAGIRTDDGKIREIWAAVVSQNDRTSIQKYVP